MTCVSCHTGKKPLQVWIGQYKVIGECMVSANFFLLPLVVIESDALVNAVGAGISWEGEWKEIKLIFFDRNWNNTCCKQLLVSNVSFNEPM